MYCPGPVAADCTIMPLLLSTLVERSRCLKRYNAKHFLRGRLSTRAL